MAEVLQGTTPTLEVVIDATDFAVTDVVKLELTFENAGVISTHDLTEVSVDAVANSISYSFTQAETLALRANDMMWYQLRFGFQDGSIVGTKKASLRVSDLISEETL